MEQLITDPEEGVGPTIHFATPKLIRQVVREQADTAPTSDDEAVFGGHTRGRAPATAGVARDRPDPAEWQAEAAIDRGDVGDGEWPALSGHRGAPRLSQFHPVSIRCPLHAVGFGMVLSDLLGRRSD